MMVWVDKVEWLHNLCSFMDEFYGEFMRRRLKFNLGSAPPLKGLPFTRRAHYGLLAYFLVYGEADGDEDITYNLRKSGSKVRVDQPDISVAARDFEALGWLEIEKVSDAGTRLGESRRKYKFIASHDEVYEKMCSCLASAAETRQQSLDELADLKKEYSF